MIEASLTESELRGLMDTWTESHDTFMDAVADALARKAVPAPEARTLTDAAISGLIAQYDAIVRKNTTPDYNALAAVASCDEGIYGAFGEITEMLSEEYPTFTDADSDVLEIEFKAYQSRLRAELGEIR
jgi:hypothetical protein